MADNAHSRLFEGRRGSTSPAIFWNLPSHSAGANPTTNIKHLKASKRTRVLTEPELVDIWLACEDDDFGCIVKLLMLTGQRKLEIGNLEWSEFITAKRQIELPEHRVKNKQPPHRATQRSRPGPSARPRGGTTMRDAAAGARQAGSGQAHSRAPRLAAAAWDHP